MTHEEAVEWLRGNKSWVNLIPNEPIDTRDGRVAQADAFTTQQAYWIVRAKKEGLVEL